MKWVVAALMFAMAVSLSVGTAAVRSGNVQLRQQIERRQRELRDLEMECGRLQVKAMSELTPEKLAVALRQLIEQRDRQVAGGVQ